MPPFEPAAESPSVSMQFIQFPGPKSAALVLIPIPDYGFAAFSPWHAAAIAIIVAGLLLLALSRRGSGR